jgi:hypothetical protein
LDSLELLGAAPPAGLSDAEPLFARSEAGSDSGLWLTAGSEASLSEPHATSDGRMKTLHAAFAATIKPHTDLAIVNLHAGRRDGGPMNQ